MKQQIDIVYEDEHLVVANKPPFLLSIPDRFSPEKPNLYHQLLALFEKVITVHRLDKETSGILVFAKTEEAHRLLSAQFMERTTDKIYYALVEGVVQQEEGVIDKPLGPHPTVQGKMAIVTKGKPSVTAFKVAERFKNYTLLEANIKTGRTHQIRVHLQSIGYPLAVDAMYGRKTEFMLSDVKLRKFKLGKYVEEERPLMARSTLHAGRLTFDHPATGERVTFEAALPKDFAAVLSQLRKWGK